MGKLPMVDPHEYIDYLLTTRRVVVPEDDILYLARLLLLLIVCQHPTSPDTLFLKF